MIRAKITGWGKYLPKKVLTNADLEKIVETSDEWITTRTGIKERRVVSDGETSSAMGAEAARIAINKAGLSPEDIEMVIFATMTPDRPFPASACLVQDKLNIPKAGTTDLMAACGGFVYGMSLANAYIVSGMYKNILLIGAESMTRILNWKDRNTCVLFGDGAGAVVVSRNEKDDSGFVGFKLRGDGQYKDCLYMPAGGSLRPASHETVDSEAHYLKMNGSSTFKVAVREMSDILVNLLAKENVKKEDLSLLIPHQANRRIIEGISERMKFPMEKIYINLDKYGNTSAATIPIALTEALEEKRIKKDDLVAAVALGAGFTWGAGLMKW